MPDVGPPSSERWPLDRIAAIVNGALVLAAPLIFSLIVELRPEDGGNVSARVSPLGIVIVRELFGHLALVILFAPPAGIVAWRTRVYARQFILGRSSGWRGVVEAALLALAVAVLLLLPSTFRAPFQAPPYIVFYGGAAMVFGAVVGVLLRWVALLSMSAAAAWKRTRDR